jgi:hypothetical protein
MSWITAGDFRIQSVSDLTASAIISSPVTSFKILIIISPNKKGAFAPRTTGIVQDS